MSSAGWKSHGSAPGLPKTQARIVLITLRVSDTTQVMIQAATVAVGGAVEELRLAGFFRRCVRVLEDVRTCRFNADGIGDWQLIEYCGDGL